MAKAHDAALAFLKKAESPSPNGSSKPFKESFEAQAAAARNSFHGLFGEGRLSSDELELLDTVIYDYAPADGDDALLHSHLEQLKSLSAEIKAITRQSVLLHGERIYKAQQLLLGYREGAFSRWLVALYGNRQTPYSMLRYYQLYQALPTADKALFEALPRKAAYMLAMREGPLDSKRALLGRWRTARQGELEQAIREAFPLAGDDGRQGRSATQRTLDDAERLLNKIDRHKAALDDAERQYLTKTLLTALYLLECE